LRKFHCSLSATRSIWTQVATLRIGAYYTSGSLWIVMQPLR
jgi:hypothetical protein